MRDLENGETATSILVGDDDVMAKVLRSTPMAEVQSEIVDGIKKSV